MGAKAYNFLPISHPHFTKQCPMQHLERKTHRCRNMRACDRANVKTDQAAKCAALISVLRHQHQDLTQEQQSSTAHDIAVYSLCHKCLNDGRDDDAAKKILHGLGLSTATPKVSGTSNRAGTPNAPQADFHTFKEADIPRATPTPPAARAEPMSDPSETASQTSSRTFGRRDSAISNSPFSPQNSFQSTFRNTSQESTPATPIGEHPVFGREVREESPFSQDNPCQSGSRKTQKVSVNPSTINVKPEPEGPFTTPTSTYRPVSTAASFQRPTSTSTPASSTPRSNRATTPSTQHICAAPSTRERFLENENQQLRQRIDDLELSQRKWYCKYHALRRLLKVLGFQMQQVDEMDNVEDLEEIGVETGMGSEE